jgi:hypothetical protein
MYVTRMEAAGNVPLADFEDDIDVTTGAAPGITLRGDSLSTWREATLELRSRNQAATSASQENQALWLGWNNRIRGDTTVHGPPGVFEVSLPAGFAADHRLDQGSSLDLHLAATEAQPGPRRDPRPEDERDEENEAEPTPPTDRGDEEDEDAGPPPVDLTVELEDASGRLSRLPLSRYGPIRRPLEIRILRRQDLEADTDHSELVLQSFHLPMTDFVEASPGFEPGSVVAVRLVFDRVALGEVVVDDIAFSRLPADFWEARIRE